MTRPAGGGGATWFAAALFTSGWGFTPFGFGSFPPTGTCGGRLLDGGGGGVGVGGFFGNGFFAILQFLWNWECADAMSLFVGEGRQNLLDAFVQQQLQQAAPSVVRVYSLPEPIERGTHRTHPQR